MSESQRAALLAFTELARGDDGVPAAVASGVTQVTELTQADDEATREMAVRAMAVLGAHALELAQLHAFYASVTEGAAGLRDDNPFEPARQLRSCWHLLGMHE